MSDAYELRGVKFSYGGHTVVDIKALNIPEGGIIGLTGPNGSGKSTLLKLLAFLLTPASGEILYQGEKTAGRERELRRCATLLLQDHYLLRTSVRKNITYGLELRGASRAEADAAAADSLARVGLRYGDFADRMWFRLSGGEARRVSLAARLALRPKVLLLDEPTANVDESSADKIKEAIMSARDGHGSTVVVATHDLAWMHEAATAIIGMFEGGAAAGAANLLYGDWKPDGGDGLAALEIEGAVFRAEARNTGVMKCASADPSDISIGTEPGGLEDDYAGGSEKTVNRVHGVVIQMTLERQTGAILATVDCGGVTLRARLPQSDALARNICPGVRVCLSFPASSLKFI